MAEQPPEDKKAIRGYGDGGVDTVLSVDDVARDAEKLASNRPTPERLDELCKGEALLSIEGLVSGYGKMEIIHKFDLRVGSGQSLCLIGPNGAGKSTIESLALATWQLPRREKSIKRPRLTTASSSSRLATMTCQADRKPSVGAGRVQALPS